MTDQEKTRKASRRQFLKGAAMVGVGGVAAGVAAGCTSPAASTTAPAAAPTCPPPPACPPAPTAAPVASEIPTKWDMETDVVVVGTGAGLAAAIEAADAGAKVIVIDKADHAGGYYICAGGSCTMGGGTSVQKKAGVTDDLEAWYDAEMAASDYRGVPEMIRTYVNKAVDTVDWLEKLGFVWAPLSAGVLPTPPNRGHQPAQSPNYPGGQGTPSSGIVWTTVMMKRVQAQGTPVLLKHKMTKVYRQPKGPAVGIQVDNEGKIINIKARKAVILATGGFTENEAMCGALDPRIVGPETFGDGGIPGRPLYNEPTGDGHAAALDIGAEFTDMSFVSFLYLFYGSKTYWIWEPRDFSKPNCLNGRGLGLGGEKTQRLILVKNDGARYVNESAPYNPDIPELDFTASYLNLKVRPRNVWAITDADGAANLTWTLDQFAKADPTKLGALSPDCLATADTIDDLAKKIGIPAAGLQATITKYNGFAAAGEDKDFKKPKPLYPLAKAPFFAAKLSLIRHTQVGGVRVNTKLQVIERSATFGKALPIDQQKTIPHLYATGEVAGGQIGWRRVHNKIGHYISFARIAGVNAAAEPSLT